MSAAPPDRTARLVLDLGYADAAIARDLAEGVLSQVNGTLIGRDPRNNTGYHLTVHITINAKGEPTAEVFNESIRCNG